MSTTLKRSTVGSVVASNQNLPLSSSVVPMMTTVASLPSAPVKPQVTAVTDMTATLAWQATQDTGDALVDSYTVQVWAAATSALVSSAKTATKDDLEATVESLAPSTAYYATIVRVAFSSGSFGLLLLTFSWCEWNH